MLLVSENYVVLSTILIHFTSRLYHLEDLLNLQMIGESNPMTGGLNFSGSQTFLSLSYLSGFTLRSYC